MAGSQSGAPELQFTSSHCVSLAYDSEPVDRYYALVTIRHSSSVARSRVSCPRVCLDWSIWCSTAAAPTARPTSFASTRGKLTAVIEPDAGQADAVNKGLARGTGAVIGWLNSDDVYYPGACARALDVFESHPDVDVVYGEADHIDQDDRVIEPYYTEPFSYERLKDVCFLCQPAVFFRRSVVDRYGPLADRFALLHGLRILAADSGRAARHSSFERSWRDRACTPRPRRLAARRPCIAKSWRC